MPRRKALARSAVALLLAGALAALLLGGVLSQSNGKQSSEFGVDSNGRPEANWAAHCARVPEGPPPKHRSSLILGLNSVWNDDCNLAAVAGAGVTMERLEIPWSDVERRPGKWDFAEFDKEFARAARH